MLAGRKPWNEKGTLRYKTLLMEFMACFNRGLQKLVTGFVDKKVTEVIMFVVIENIIIEN